MLEFECIPDKNIQYSVRKAQAQCAVDSAVLLLELTNLFNECSQKVEHYGSAKEGNRVRVVNLRLEMRE